MNRYVKNEDLNGYIRGAHKDGVEVCPAYEFHLPGSSSTPEKTVWGWNDVASFDCEKCKLPAVDHIVLREPNIVKEKPEDPRKRGMADLPPGAVTSMNVGASRADPTAIDPGVVSEQRRQRQAEEAAFINAGYSPDGMLDEDNDPLAIAARPKPKPKPPPPPAPPPTPSPAYMAGQPPPAPFSSTGADLAEGVQDAALQELLSRDASANEAFKREVERMVREANRESELNARLGTGAPVAPPPVVSEVRNLTGCAVPAGTYADARALLLSVGLERYESTFNEEAMEPDTLIEVLTQQGKGALEDALKELSIKSMGHRLKIINALIVQ